MARLIEVLLDYRPGDLQLAWEALAPYPSPRRRIAAAVASLDTKLRRRLVEATGAEELAR